ncbi:MFS transporter [Streptomyces kunmingensis]|uniref:MFS transporter n=1 Tax=Streptomyces kunmingensis TaxID=68225 RepID=A0ABU6C2J8_9ACTN|nr:MFS transporter [Streptomyces kunmingensis]MEB3958927.1 MFS transporter [Streptomyces kunmingensis]
MAPRTMRSRGAFLTLVIAFACVMLGATLPTPMYPLYQQEMGFSPVIQTVIFASYAVGVLAALLLCGGWSDIRGRRPLLLAGLLFSMGSSLVFLWAGQVWILLVGRLLSGISAGIFAGTATAAVIDSAPEAWRSRAPNAATAANIGGLGLGSAVAGLFVEYLPAPLELSFGVHAALICVLVVLLRFVPETVERRPGTRLRPRKIKVPDAARGMFVSAATVGFAGFAVTGLFTAVAPRIVADVVGNPNHALAGAMPLLLLGASALTQVVLPPARTRLFLLAGCLLLAAGILLVALSVHQASLPLLAVGAVVAGCGQGMSFAKGLAAVDDLVDSSDRAAVSSAYFVVLYVAISLPVVGLGAASQAWGLRTAGVWFCVAAAALAVAAWASLVRGR